MSLTADERINQPDLWALHVVSAQLAEKVDNLIKRLGPLSQRQTLCANLTNVEYVPRELLLHVDGVHYKATLLKCWGDYPDEFAGEYRIREVETHD